MSTRVSSFSIMFRFVVICGCLMAIAQAGIISGRLITAMPAVEPTLSYRTSAVAVALPSIASATSSNIIRGNGPYSTPIGPVTTVHAGEKELVSHRGFIADIGATDRHGIGYIWLL